MRVDLQCPYSEKDVAKSLGARWDADKKVWYVIDPDNMMLFKRWLGKYIPKKNSNKKNNKRRKPKKQNAHKNGSVTIGKNYVEEQTSSSVPPWEYEDPPELIRFVREIGLGV